MSVFLQVLYYVSILLSVVLAVRSRKKLAERKLGIMLPFLVYVILQEATLRILTLSDTLVTNDIVYNFYRLLTVIVFMLVYARVRLMSNFKKLIYITAGIYCLFTLLNYIFFESVFEASKYLPILRGITITFFGILFLLNFFQLDEGDREDHWRPLLWITIGVVVFYPVTSIVLNLQPYLRTQSATIGGVKLYNLIPRLMSVFMYGCFAYSFYICRTAK